MAEMALAFFDTDKLVKEINRARGENVPKIVLGEFESRDPKKNPFLYTVCDRRVEHRGKFRLYLPHEMACWHPFNSEGKIGYVFVETGKGHALGHGIGTYECLRLRIKTPLRLSTGGVIPNCSVKISRYESDHDLADPVRKNHQRYGPLWVRSNLEEVLPTGWFLREC